MGHIFPHGLRSFRASLVRNIEKTLCFKAKTHIAHFIRKCFLDKICFAVRGDLGPKSGAQKYPKYEKVLVFILKQQYRKNAF